MPDYLFTNYSVAPFTPVWFPLPAVGLYIPHRRYSLTRESSCTSHSGQSRTYGSTSHLASIPKESPPVPSYNWTRKGSSLPRGAFLASSNRVLVIPNVQVEDEGVYVCRAYNRRASIENSVILNIQAEPTFTIPLTDKHIDSKGDLVWTCEAFGVPDVNYTWWRNGRQLALIW
ncbi:unnamed protein product [Acanthoscelides obtectus]|uniref:Ig-like domain-containing protein n=1 Tax=Acanthoscelides obtectus TaxID=200917 RepID=A0A9P0PF09_ACAOB|nr:unnamed protein product [Acanthoscelides obtectus]CAK1655949.1 Contactin [Acanthoscelides obtectus]